MSCSIIMEYIIVILHLVYFTPVNCSYRCMRSMIIKIFLWVKSLFDNSIGHVLELSSFISLHTNTHLLFGGRCTRATYCPKGENSILWINSSTRGYGYQNQTRDRFPCHIRFYTLKSVFFCSLLNNLLKSKIFTWFKINLNKTLWIMNAMVVLQTMLGYCGFFRPIGPGMS